MRARHVLAQAVAFVAALLLASPVGATLVWTEGFEAQSLAIGCAGGTSASNVSIATSAPRSGNAYVTVTGVSAGTPGRCTILPAGQNLTGTIYVFGSVMFDSTTTCSSLTSKEMLNLGEVQLKHTCLNGTNGHTLILTESGNDIGLATGFLSEDTQYQIKIKIKTGSGDATLDWSYSTNGTSWIDQASQTALTIANVDLVEWLYPRATGTTTGTYTFALDDFVLLSGGTAPLATTRVNFRAPTSGTPAYDFWTKTGGSGTIQSVWTSRFNPDASSCPATVYARSGNTSSLEQTAILAAWNSGTPTPTASGSSTWLGCKWDLYAGRCNGSTNRTYASRRRFNGSDVDVSITPPTSYTLYSKAFDLAGASLTQVNGMEFGAIKASATSGAVLDVLDVWVQCAWSDPVANTLFMWTQER